MRIDRLVPVPVRIDEVGIAPSHRHGFQALVGHRQLHDAERFRWRRLHPHLVVVDDSLRTPAGSLQRVIIVVAMRRAATADKRCQCHAPHPGTMSERAS